MLIKQYFKLKPDMLIKNYFLPSQSPQKRIFSYNVTKNSTIPKYPRITNNTHLRSHNLLELFFPNTEVNPIKI